MFDPIPVDHDGAVMLAISVAAIVATAGLSWIVAMFGVWHVARTITTDGQGQEPGQEQGQILVLGHRLRPG